MLSACTCARLCTVKVYSCTTPPRSVMPIYCKGEECVGRKKWANYGSEGWQEAVVCHLRTGPRGRLPGEEAARVLGEQLLDGVRAGVSHSLCN